MSVQQRKSSNAALLLALGGATLLCSACGGAQLKMLQQRVATLHDEVSELRQGQAAQRVQFDEFRNRLVMLQDKLESEQVRHARAMAHVEQPERPPSLPHVVLPATAAQQAAASDRGVGQLGRSHSAAVTGAHSAATAGAATRSVVIGPNGVVQVKDKSRRASATRSQTAGRVAAAPSASSDGQPPRAQGPAERAAGSYRDAKAQLDAGNLRAARDMFTVFIRDHNAHPLADNALYWMGETWYAQSLWLRAARLFGQVVERYPRGNKVPDAMLKTALCYINLGEHKLARDTLQQVSAMYPGTGAARIARKKLASIRSGS